jgi:hypothetical protein
MPIESSNAPQAFQRIEKRGWETISNGYEQHFARVVRHARYVTFKMAEVAVPRALF